MIPKLPERIVGCFVGYVNDREMHRPHWAERLAKRAIQPLPSQGIIDDTVYDTLRPRVMICSRAFKDDADLAFFSTISSVLVNNPAGDCFMIGPSHGIGPFQTVWQAMRYNGIVGEVVEKISFTDVSLIQSRQGVQFANEVFEDTTGIVPEFAQFVTSDDELAFVIAHLNSPYTGKMQGAIVAHSIRMEGSPHSTEDNIPIYHV